jgi:biopolymer transport protein ExbD
MARPGDFLNRFRYAVLAVLTVLTIGYGYYLYRTYVPAAPPSPPPSIAVAVMVDGSIRIDGALYTSPDKLKIKVAQIQKEHPDAGFTIQAAYGAHFEPIGKAVSLLQKSGAKTIWVVNEPKKNP